MYFNYLDEEKRTLGESAPGTAVPGPMEDRLGQLRGRVETWLQDSDDMDFTEYLLQMKERIANQDRQVRLLTDELDRRIQMYENNQQMRRTRQEVPAVEQPMEETLPEMPIGAESPVEPAVEQPVQEIMSEEPTVVGSSVEPAVEQPMQETPPEMPIEAESSVEPAMEQPVEETPPEMPTVVESSVKPAVEETPPEMLIEAESSVEPAVQVTVEQPVPQAGQIAPQMPQTAPRPAVPKRNAEFMVGTAVLSITGGAFILTAMVLLGMYFMKGLMKGLLLYAACAAVLLVAELLLYRRWPRLGMVFSAIGMGGLYISTLVNYLALGNFNQWWALGITLLITLGVILLSRKRDAVSYRILGMVAMYVCILAVPRGLQYNGGLSQLEWVTITVMALVINVMCLIVPVRKSHTGINVTHMALNTGFTLWVYMFWFDEAPEVFDHVGEMWQYPLFVAMSLLVMQLIFVAQVKWHEKQAPGCTMVDNAGICVVYGISSLIYMLLVSQTTDFAGLIASGGTSGDLYLGYRLVCTGVAVILCLIPLIGLRGRQEKWFAWYLLNLVVIAIHSGSADDWEFSICLVVLLAVSKLLSFTRNKLLRNSDAALTAFACLFVLLDREFTYVVPLFVALLLSVLCINYWNVYFETILTLTIAVYVSGHMLSGLKLPVFVGILFVGMLIFNNVGRWHGKGMEIYNALMLIGQALCYILLVNPVYQNAYLTYLCMLVFGVATITICFQKKYHLDFGGKQLVLAVFLTYMGLVVRSSYPIVNSILLMLIALVSVGGGFIAGKKSVRIYGLVLSLLVCGKLVLYDFMGANILQKTIVFFVVGVLALVIAAIYMILEHSQGKKALSGIQK